MRPSVEAREPERRLAVDRPPVLAQRGIELALPLEHLPEVVVRLRVLRVDGQRPAVRLGGLIPLLLQAEQHAVVVVRIGEVEPELHGRAVVRLRLRPVLCAGRRA